MKLLKRIEERKLNKRQKERLESIQKHFCEVVDYIEDKDTKYIVMAGIRARVMCYLDELVPKGQRITKLDINKNKYVTYYVDKVV